MALKEVLGRYSANRHSGDFADALKKGSVLLWVGVRSPKREAEALRLLAAAGGQRVHIHARTAEARKQ
jgi:tRNA-dihydrouridine synthase